MYQEKLNMLLEKYDVPAAATMETAGHVVIDQTEYPLLAHRFERRFTEMRKLLHDGTVAGVSAIRCGHVADANTSLTDLIRRELDICRFLSGREIVSVSAFEQGDRAAMILAELADGVVCSLELAHPLPAGAAPIDKHEVITARGLVCDRVVDTQIPQQSIYVYAETIETYTDVDFELYGLSAGETAAVRAAFALAKDPALRRQSLEETKTLCKLTDCVMLSARTGRKVNV